MSDMASTEGTEQIDGSEIVDPDPRQMARDAYDQRIREGGTDDDAGVASLRTLVTAAVNGDARVIYDPAQADAERLQRLLDERRPPLGS